MTTATPSARLPRLTSLDGVRGIFALGVFATHAFVTGFRGAWIGVDVFFVLSGYLITTILLREHHRTGRLDLVRFYASRFLRLYPVLLLTVATGVVLYKVLPAHVLGERSLRTSTLATLSYTENLVVGQRPSVYDPWSHTWSLSEEEQFYLLWPLLLAALLVLSRGRAVVGAVALAGASAAALLMTEKGAYYLPWTHATGLAAGAAVGLLLFHRGVVPALRRPAVGIASCIGLLGMLAYLDQQPFASKRALVIGVLGTALFAGVLVAHLSQNRESPMSKLLSFTPLVLVGRWSYAFYLIHVPVLATTGAHMDHWPAVALSLVCTLAFAALLHRLVERPMDGLRHRWFSAPAGGRDGR